MMRPEQVEEGVYEIAVARVAAVDVAKAAGVVCTRVPREGEPGRFVTEVWTFGSTTNAIVELADHLTGLRVEKVVLESTRDYWRPSSTCWKPPGCRGGVSSPGVPRAAQDDRIAQMLELYRRQQARARRAIAVLVVTEIAAVVVTACLAALLWHSPGLAALAGTAAALVFTVSLVIRLLALAGTRRARPWNDGQQPRPPDDPSREPSP